MSAAQNLAPGLPQDPTDLGPIGVVDGHTRESQISAWQASCGAVSHPDQQVGTVRLHVQISADGLSYRVNDSAWLPTHATTLHRLALRPEFDPKKLPRQLRAAGFPAPRGKAVAGGSYTIERRLPLYLDCEQGECIDWVPGHPNFERLGHDLVVFPFLGWDNEFVSAIPPQDGPL
jgi:hypothetical protein